MQVSREVELPADLARAYPALRESLKRVIRILGNP
jgi:hypothetical protein